MKKHTIRFVTAALVGWSAIAQSTACDQGNEDENGEETGGTGGPATSDGIGESGDTGGPGGLEGDGGSEEPGGMEGGNDPQGDVDPADPTVLIVKAVVENFLGKAVANNVYNGWFSNGSADPLHLSNCLVHQVSTVLEVPNAHYSGATDVEGLNDLYGDGDPFTCLGMQRAHTGLAIPSTAYDALVADVILAVGEEAPDQATEDAVLAALTAAFDADFKGSIVDEDQDDEATNTAYNFLGGKPAILTLLVGEDCDPASGGDQPCFISRVLGDPSLAEYFDAAVARDGGSRLVTCLQRQISGDLAGGPDNYDFANGLVEIALRNDPEDPTAITNCQSMLDSHRGLGITDEAFEALDLHAATALTLLLQSPAEGTKAADIIGAVAAALTGNQICEDIIESTNEARDCAQFDPDDDPDRP